MEKFEIIIGPCALESREQAIQSVARLKQIEREINNQLIQEHDDIVVEFIYKSCVHKANRTKAESFHGIGVEAGITILQEIKTQFPGLRVTCDVHSEEEVEKVKDTLDIIQIPQSLSRYTKLIQAAARTGKDISIKKGVFMGPTELTHAYKKVQQICEDLGSRVILIERGNKFGYDDTVVDFLNLKLMNELGAISCMDASHPARARENVFTLAQMGIIGGAQMLFIEAHLTPDQALCDGKTSVRIDETLKENILHLIKLYDTIKRSTKQECHYHEYTSN